MEKIADNNVGQTTASLIKESLKKAISYKEYRDLVRGLSEEKKSTGSNQSQALIDYTILNDKRMKRLDKTVKLKEEDIEKIKYLDKQVTLLVITESWCGDAAQTMPVMHKVAECNKSIDLKVLQRDQNLDLMNRFLSNGTLAIPKLILLDSATNDVIGEWGSRPKVATKMVEDFKNTHGALTPEFKQELQVWYNKDKGQSTVQDLIELLSL